MMTEGEGEGCRCACHYSGAAPDVLMTYGEMAAVLFGEMAAALFVAALLALLVGPGLWYVLEHLSISVRWTP